MFQCVCRAAGQRLWDGVYINYGLCVHGDEENIILNSLWTTAKRYGSEERDAHIILGSRAHVVGFGLQMGFVGTTITFNITRRFFKNPFPQTYLILFFVCFKGG